MRRGGFYRLWAIATGAVTAVSAAIMMVGGMTHYPDAARDLAAFRKDAGCVSGFALEPVGLCRVVDAAVVRSRAGDLAHMRVKMPDGRTEAFDLYGPSGDSLAGAVSAGDPIRLQLFGGQVVAVKSRGIVAQTSLAPEVRMQTAAVAPVVIAIFAVVFALVWVLRRAGLWLRPKASGTWRSRVR